MPKTEKSVSECPFYKKIPSTPFVVDAFSYNKIPGATAYFLTHFHSDHYIGIDRKYDFGTIYCSSITRNLLIQELKVQEDFIKPLDLNTRYCISNIYCTFIDANHCPGAVMILFEIPTLNGYNKILHTGDFRATSNMSHLFKIELDSIYLDTTYFSEHYQFPLQSHVIQIASQLSKCFLVERKSIKAVFSKSSQSGTLLKWLKAPIKGKDTLIIVGSYKIGKERLFVEMAKSASSLIYVKNDKAKVLNTLEWPELENMLTSDPLKASIHVIPMGNLNQKKMTEYLDSLDSKWDQVVTIKPTGWTFGKSNSLELSLKRLNPKISHLTVNSRRIELASIGIPYSEHSSFNELECFLKGFEKWPQSIIPTVHNGNPHARKRMHEILKCWRSEHANRK